MDDAIRRTCLLIDELEQEEAELEQTKLQHAVELSLIPTEGLVQQHSTQIHSSPTRIYDESKSTSQPPPQQLNRAALPPVASIDIAPSKSQQQSSDRIESKSNDMKAVADHNRKGTSPINAISSNLPSIMSSITEEQKVRERGIHMAQQREKLLAIKKATRDKKVEEEAERAIADPTHAKLTERAQGM